MPSRRPITFIVPGSLQTLAAGASRGAAAAVLPAGLQRGTAKHTVSVGATRGGAAPVRIDAVPGEDVVVLVIAGGPELVLHPETARDLLLAQTAAKRGRGGNGAGRVGELEV